MLFLTFLQVANGFRTKHEYLHDFGELGSGVGFTQDGYEKTGTRE